MSDPAFLQFAAECKTTADQYGDALFGDACEQLRQAERHARLLAAVSAWANAPDTEHDHSPLARAHVRALLAQSEEKER